MFEYKLIEIENKHIHYFKFDNQYEACVSFMRMQEFYESPDPYIRGKFFTIEKFMDSYAKREGNFTYTQDWNGFNIPGEIVRNWYKKHLDTSKKENALLLKLQSDIFNNDQQFYVVGSSPTKDGAVIDHELCHAFYYLDENFREDSRIFVNELNSRNFNKLFDKIREQGYDENVLFDELIAYLATSSQYYIRNKFEMDNKNLWWVRKGLQSLFINYAKRFGCYDLLRYK